MQNNFTASEYHKILCPDPPPFLDEYASLSLVSRLEGVGLLCGTDWTPLFNNRFYYSRLDHSVGVALIIWNFTHDKKQTLAGLFHDVSTRAFSHVIDFKNGDALKQESSEDINKMLIDKNEELLNLLLRDGLSVCEIDDYHVYPVADNDCPGLSADRLEYMYPSGASLCGEWTLDQVRKNYAHIKVLTNERGLPELGFDSQEAALTYTKKFTDIGLLMQRNEDKIAMQLLADVVSRACETCLITEEDLFLKTETELMALFDRFALNGGDKKFSMLHKTYRTMTKVLHTDSPLKDHYCVSLNVKKRYVDPLVLCKNNSMRISKINTEAKKIIDDFLSYTDTAYGCTPYSREFKIASVQF